MKGFLTLFFSFSCLLFSTEKTFIRDYTYETNVLDTKESARIISLTALKTILLEEVGVYIQSELNINTKEILKDGNYEITESVDQTLNSITAGVTKVKILDEKWDKRLIKATYWIKAKIILDPDNVQADIEDLVEKNDYLKALEDSKKQAALAMAELKLIRKQLEDSEKEKEELRSKYERETKTLLVLEEIKKVENKYRKSMENGIYPVEGLELFKQIVDKFSDFNFVYGITASSFISIIRTSHSLETLFDPTKKAKRAAEKKSPGIRRYYTISENKIGDIRYCIELLLKASEFENSDDYSHNFAYCYLLLGQYDNAIKYLKQSIKKYPVGKLKKLKTKKYLSYAYYGKGDYQASIDTKLEIISTSKRQGWQYVYGFKIIPIYRRIAEIYLYDLNNANEASRYFDETVNESNKIGNEVNKVYPNRIYSEYFISLKNLDSTIYYHKRYIDGLDSDDSDNPFFLTYLTDDIVELAIEKSQFDLAIDLLKQKIELYNKKGRRDPWWFIQIGDVYLYNLNDHQNAIEYYNKVLTMVDNLRSKGHFPRGAVAEAEYAIYITLGKIYNRQKQNDKSIQFLEKVLALKEDAKNEAELVREKYNFRYADDLSIGINFSSTYCYLANSYMNQGKLLLNDGEYDLAIQYCKKSLELENYQEKLLLEDDTYDCWHDFSFTYYLLGLAQYRIGDNSEAIQNLEYSIIMDNQFYGPYKILGLIYHEKNDYIKTVLNLKKAIDLEPNCIDCYYYLGIEYIKKQNMPGAAENIEKAVDLGHNSLWAFKSLASHYYKYQDFEKSEKYYREAYKLEKDFESCYQLGVIYSKQNKNFDAIEFFEEANKLKPDNPRILSNLGKLHYKIAIAYHNNDAWPKALTFYRKAAKLDHKKTQEFLKKNGYDW